MNDIVLRDLAATTAAQTRTQVFRRAERLSAVVAGSHHGMCRTASCGSCENALGRL